MAIDGVIGRHGGLAHDAEDTLLSNVDIRERDDMILPPHVRLGLCAIMSFENQAEILAAYDAVRSDKEETNWLILSYAAATGDKLKLTETGAGGLSELTTKLDNSQAQYAYVRVEYANDTESKRVKFVLVIWIGEGTKVMRKARVSIESGAVKKILGHHSIQVDARDKSDLDEKEIVVRLRKAGGADYNGGRG